MCACDSCCVVGKRETDGPRWDDFFLKLVYLNFKPLCRFSSQLCGDWIYCRSSAVFVQPELAVLGITAGFCG